MQVEDGGNGQAQEPDPDVIPLYDGLPVDANYLMFVVQLALHDGNASAAARSIGWSADRGRKMCNRHPELRDLARRALGMSQRETVRRWADMHATALNTINELMNGATDERVKLEAAKTAIERIEGKAPLQAATPETPAEEVLENVAMRFAAAYHIQRGISLGAALMYAERNPDEVSEWGRRVGLIPTAA